LTPRFEAGIEAGFEAGFEARIEAARRFRRKSRMGFMRLFLCTGHASLRAGEKKMRLMRWFANQ